MADTSSISCPGLLAISWDSVYGFREAYLLKNGFSGNKKVHPHRRRMDDIVAIKVEDAARLPP